MNTSETSQTSSIEASTESFQKGLIAFREGDKESAKTYMQEVISTNPYDIGAMVILSLMDPEFEKEAGLFSSEEHRKAFVEITKSPHAKNLRRVGNNLILQLATDSAQVGLKIVDIGIGTAVQESELIRRLADSTSVKKVEIIGIEPAKEMSGMAMQRLQSPEVQNTGIGVDFKTVNATGQDIPAECVDEIKGSLVDVVLATISAHHATIEEKRKTLRAIRAMNPKYFVLADVNSDHESDLPKFSNELADNVRRFYSLAYQTLCEWADKNFPGREDIKAAFKKFNFDEARNILSRDYPNVADYHTTADRWRQLMQEEGFRIVNPQSIKGITNGIEGDMEVTDDTIYMLITENRKLFFALIVEPIKNFTDVKSMILTSLQKELDNPDFDIKIRTERERMIRKGDRGNVWDRFNGLTFPHRVPMELMDDEDVLLAAMRVNGEYFCYVPEKMQGNKKIALAAVSNLGTVLEILPDVFKADKDIVLAAVAQDGKALQFASDGLRGDREVVLAAVAQDGKALQFASDGLRGDREVVLAAVAQDGKALQFASDGLRGDREFILVVVKEDGATLRYASEKLRDDEEVIICALERTGYAFGYASSRLRAQKHIIIMSVSKYSAALQYVESKALKQDPEILEAYKMGMRKELEDSEDGNIGAW